MHSEPNIQDCFNLYESIRLKNRQKIKKLEELRNMMSKRWEEEINNVIHSEREEDWFFGHERSNIAITYRTYATAGLRRKMPIQDFEIYFLSRHASKQDFLFLKACLPIFAAMFEQESKRKQDTGE